MLKITEICKPIPAFGNNAEAMLGAVKDALTGIQFDKVVRIEVTADQIKIHKGSEQ